jgi:copper chaperone CopZ
MTHTYKIQGMTCNGCVTSVTNKLSKIDGVENITVNLDKAEAEIEMNRHLSIDVFQDTLAPKYKISEKIEKNIFSSATHNEEQKTGLQQLKPLFLIFFYISVASLLLNIKSWNGSAFMLNFMGLFYIVFSFFKMLDLKGFPESFKMYDPLAKLIPAYGWIYPFIETVLGLMFLFRFKIDVALVITLIVLGLTTIGVTKSLLDKKSIQCACLGTALKLPMTKATFIENSIMIVMALIMLLK